MKSFYFTDTIGSNGWDEIEIICRDCGKTLKRWETR